jgi:hypothetical protein
MDEKGTSFSDGDEILPESDFSQTRPNKYASRSDAVRRRLPSPTEVLQASGLVGCGEAAPDLSEHYKEEVKRQVAAKQGSR